MKKIVLVVIVLFAVFTFINSYASAKSEMPGGPAQTLPRDPWPVFSER